MQAPGPAGLCKKRKKRGTACDEPLEGRGDHAAECPCGPLRTAKHDDLVKALAKIETDYYETLDAEQRKALRVKAVRAMAESLDEYSTYFPPGRFEAFERRMDGFGQGLAHGLCGPLDDVGMERGFANESLSLAACLDLDGIQDVDESLNRNDAGVLEPAWLGRPALDLTNQVDLNAHSIDDGRAHRT